MTKSAWAFNGGKTTIGQGLESPDREFSQWCSRVVELISKIALSVDFEVKDNGYRRFPGVLVTDGIKCHFRGEQFEVWSDVPGEIIIRHESMGSRLTGELIDRLAGLWSQMLEEESRHHP